MAKLFRVTHRKTGEVLCTYEADTQNNIGGVNPEDVVQTEVTPQFLETERKAAKAVEIKAKIRQILIETDWTQLGDTPLTAASALAFRVYRAALRQRLKDADTNPDTVTMPNRPNEVEGVI